MLGATHHFSITVADLERSLDWYTGVLGLELLSRQRNDNAYTKTIVGMDDAVLEVAFLALPGTAEVRLELIEYLQPRAARPELTTNMPGAAHIAF
jgi:catechol 2,3-dioxygenase-like lactoylglutathione lyase family enzyme